MEPATVRRAQGVRLLPMGVTWEHAGVDPSISGSGYMEDVNAVLDRQNLTRFRSELEKGVKNGPVRSLLLDLLVEQETRFGKGEEQLEKVNRHIARLRQIIAGQVQLMDQLRAKGLSTDRAYVVLDTLNDMMLVHQSYRETIIATLAH